jgi:hypothetical protein
MTDNEKSPSKVSGPVPGSLETGSALETELALTTEVVSAAERAELELVISGRDTIVLPLEFLTDDPVIARAPSRGPPVRLEKPVRLGEETRNEEAASGLDEPAQDDEAQGSAAPNSAVSPDTTLPAAFINETDDDGDVRNSIAKMKLPEKIKAAMFGNSTARTLLIRDSNRLVQQFVLKNPRIQLREIEDFAKNPNLSEQVLRLISNNPAWTKSD